MQHGCLGCSSLKATYGFSHQQQEAYNNNNNSKDALPLFHGDVLESELRDAWYLTLKQENYDGGECALEVFSRQTYFFTHGGKSLVLSLENTTWTRANRSRRMKAQVI